MVKLSHLTCVILITSVKNDLPQVVNSHGPVNIVLQVSKRNLLNSLNSLNSLTSLKLKKKSIVFVLVFHDKQLCQIFTKGIFGQKLIYSVYYI